MTNYLELAQSLANRGHEAGVEAEVIITDSQENEIRIQAGEVEQLSQSGSRGMGIRIIDGGRQGYAYTSDFSQESIDQTWQTALELARVATEDPFRKLPEPQPLSEDDLRIWDGQLANIPLSDKIDLLKRVESAALNYDERIVLTNWCNYNDSIDHVYLANSKGFASSYGRTTCAAWLFAIARDENGGMVNAPGLGTSNFYNDLDPEAIGKEAARKALSILGGKPVATQKASVVLDPFVGAQVLTALAQALSADSWQRQRSFLIGKLGQQVGSDMVTLMSNGRLEGGLASAPFDGEGVPTQATRLIDEGVLQNLMYDSYSAAKDNVMSTGNAQRNGHRSMPGLGPGNFYMQPGHLAPEKIIEGVDKGLYVLSVMQTGGIDSVTGDCSMSANGLWIENGKITGAVGGVTIATTLEGFLNGVSQVGNDLKQVPFFGVIGVPTLRVDGVTIGGS